MLAPMPRKYAISYIDRLLEGDSYDDLVQLSSAICSSPRFASAAPDYGLPTFAFLFVEVLCWFAQSIRSGANTYYEATPIARQDALAAALRTHAPPAFAEFFERGMTTWRDESEIDAVNMWIDVNDDAANTWLRRLAKDHRGALLELT